MNESRGKTALIILITLLCILGILAMAWFGIREPVEMPEPETVPTTEETQIPTTEETLPPHIWLPGYVATMELQAEYYDETGRPLGKLIRGAGVEYEITEDGRISILLPDDSIGYLQPEATVVETVTDAVPAHTLYVRTAVNLRTAEGKLLEAFAQKGAAVQVTGCDRLEEDGSVHMYRVTLEEQEGYVLPWYLVDSKADALANYDEGDYSTHAGRGNRYGGGGAGDLDYYPRDKAPIEGNEMPEECRTLYIASWCVGNVDAYLSIARRSGINAFVVDIVDGEAVGYASAVMQENCPSAAAAAQYSVEDYRAAIGKLKAAGYYVIGRITTFNDSYYVKDHPEYAITKPDGSPLRLNGSYWPTPYNRAAWQYKVDLAVEAVELMGFNEIQFDYVRFPDLTWDYEQAGTIDYHDMYGESKAQVIQRFLMYASDRIREKGAYVGADVFGEAAYNYVTAYGQYWPAISNVADVISGMPYPDHFSASGDWKPWEHPYETLHSWGQSAVYRQQETATPAVIRTWIQAYNAIREPYNTYGPEQILAQVKGLRDAGCTGGYMTWNSGSSVEKYNSLISAFTPA